MTLYNDGSYLLPITQHEIMHREDWRAMAELKPCPFCGNEAVFINHDGGEVDVQCSCCFARGPIQETEQQAVAGWNDCIRKECEA